MFVVDASLTLSWCFPDEATAGSDAVLESLSNEPAIAPGIWKLEVANVLLVAQRRGRIREAETTRILGLLQRLPIRVSESTPALDELVDLGRRHGLTANDAAYLQLAEHLGLALGTLDEGLARAAAAAGVPLLID